MLKPLLQQSMARTLALGIVAGVGLALVAATTSAAPIISGLHKTGTEYPVGSSGQDSFWDVYALPTAYPGPLTPGYQAWVFSGGTPAPNVPRPWFPGPGNGGSDNVGANGARWIGLQDNDATALFPGSFPVPPVLSDYNVIYHTTFQADSAGLATFSLLVAADNAVSFFVGGTVDNTNPFMPTMTGQQIGSEKPGLGYLGWVEGTATVVPGTNDLYAVVRDAFVYDNIDKTNGGYAYTGLIVAAVPEPSSFVLAALGGAVMAIGVVRRRLKRSA
jgi:PEP-CTERM motif